MAEPPIEKQKGIRHLFAAGGYSWQGFLRLLKEEAFRHELIGFVIGPNLELSFRQSLQLLDHNALNLLQHPIALVFLVLTVVIAWWIGHGSKMAASLGRHDAHDFAGPEDRDVSRNQKGG